MLLPAYLLALARLVHALAPTPFGPSGVFPRDSDSDSDWDPVFEEFKFVGCEVEENDLLQAAFLHVRDMVGRKSFAKALEDRNETLT